MEENFRYDAFISYRHVEPDRKYAKWLHKSLETFKVPSDLVASGYPAKLKRIFRDEEELPASSDLSKEITLALEQSKFLIVVCSPRIVKSVWCDAEVQKFRDLGRHDKIISLLIEGEPSESFLPSLCEIRNISVDENGNQIEKIEKVEPLAADVRASRDESSRELKYLAKLRIAACLLGCKFDDLRRRELKRRQKRLLNLMMLMSFLVLGFLTLTLWAMNERQKAQQNEFIAIREKKSAEEQRKLAEQRQLEAEKSAYRANLNLALKNFNDWQYSVAADYLDQCSEKLRNWEWNYIRESLQLSGRKFAEDRKTAALSVDDKYIYTANQDSLILTDRTNLKKVRQIPLKSPIHMIKSCNENKAFVTIDKEENLTLWDRESLKKEGEIKSDGLPVSTFEFSPVGKVFAVAYLDGSINFYDSHLKKKIGSYQGTGYPCFTIAFDKEEKLLAAGGRNNISLISLEVKKEIKSIKYPGNVSGLCFLEEGNRLIAAGSIPRLKIYSGTNFERENDIPAYAENQSAHHLRIESIYTDGNRVITNTDRHVIRVFDLVTQDEQALFPAKSKIVYANGEVITSSRVFNINGNINLYGHDGFVSEVAVNTDSSKMATSGGDGNLILRSFPDLKILSEFKHKKDVQFTAFSHDGSKLISTSEEGSLYVWDINAKSLVNTKNIQDGIIFDAAIGNNDKSIFAAGNNKLFKLSSSNLEIMKALDMEEGRSYALKMSPDGSTLALNSANKLILVDAEKMIRLYDSAQHKGDILSICWNKDGNKLVTASDSGEVFIWESKNLKFTAKVEGHQAAVYSVIFSPDDSRIVTGGEDGLLRFFDSSSLKELVSLKGHKGAVLSIQWMGNRIFSSDAAGLTKIRSVLLK